MNDSRLIQGLSEQLRVLYDEKKQLHDAIGISDTHSVVQMIRSLEAQLNSLYAAQTEQQIAQNETKFDQE